MKTFILHLDQHDDNISVRDKMGWGKAGRILLIWPESGRVLNRRLDLLLLQRHSAKQGAKLAIVSRDPEVRYHGLRLGIPVFKSMRKAQKAAWRVPRRFRKYSEEEVSQTSDATVSLQKTNPRQSVLPKRPQPTLGKLNPFVRLLAFTVGVLAFLATAALLFPSAKISIQPQTSTQDVWISVMADPSYEYVDINGKVPAHWTTVIVEGRDSTPTSGTISLPDRYAEGRARFTNLTDVDVEIPAGTVIHSLGEHPVRFEVSEAGQAPAGPGQSVTLPVSCLEPGSIGNLKANQLVALEGPLGTQVNVNNPLPTRGGRQREEPAPNDEDRNQLLNKLIKELRLTAAEEIEQGLDEGDVWWNESLNLSQVLEKEYQPSDDEPSDLLQLSLRLEFEALWIPAENLQKLAGMVLDSNLPSGFVPENDQITISGFIPDQSTTNIHWDLYASRNIRALLSEPQVIQLTMGQSPEIATNRLAAAMPLAEEPQIALMPDWWPRLPILPFRITIVEID
jgi:hypothetical protein